MQALPIQTQEAQMQAALDRGWTILTANQRAARTLHHAFDRRQRALGLTSWQPPAILAWDAWTASLWHRLLLEGHAEALLLSRAQEHTVWRSAIQADQQNAGLQPVDALAETAAAAWQTLHAYRGQPRLRAAADTFDARTFERWSRAFQQLCEQRNYLSQAQLAEALRAAVLSGKRTSGSGLLLAGFDAQTPAQTALLAAIQTAAEVAVEEVPLPKPASQTLVAAADSHAELTTAAHWLRAQLTEQPSSRIAVIVPSLETERAEIDRIFRRILAPELEDIAAPTHSGPYEFSLGVPLAATRMVAAAFDILRWTTGALPLERASALLLSPYFAASAAEARDELLARAEFDAFTLRRQTLLRPEVALDAVLGVTSSARTPLLSSHLRRLRAAAARGELASGIATHSEWAATIDELLSATGWATPGLLDSTEFQTLRKWQDALDELAALDFDGRRVSFAAALESLQRIAAATLFAPESRNAPIQIMGPLESAGSTFDAIWFLRANDLAWPTRPAPNPLLPWHLQRELGVPGADHARDAALARQTATRIAASAPTVFFSYAEESGEGSQRPSPALAHLTLEACRADQSIPLETAAMPIALETFADDTPIPPPPDRVLAGGASILQAQAQCGFRAFAEKRLFASAPEAGGLGLNPSERGSIVHAVLEHFWQRVQTQAALLALPPGERGALLLDSIDHALKESVNKAASPWDHAYLDSERERLQKLLRQWLDYEATRPAFAVKAREEKQQDVRIGPLRIDIRVDRIDLVAGGDPEQPPAEIILDYKTGRAAPSDWLGSRPDQPQLPLYAVVAESANLAAVAFASVRVGGAMGIAGFAAADGILPKTRQSSYKDMPAMIEAWREVLTPLAEDFHAGNASVAPKQYPATCTYCQQRLLCRLDPAAFASLDPEEDAVG